MVRGFMLAKQLSNDGHGIGVGNKCERGDGMGEDEVCFLANGDAAVVVAQTYGVSGIDGDGVEGFLGEKTQFDAPQ